MPHIYGDLAQLVEHTAHIRAVIGSIPMVAISCLVLQGSFFYLSAINSVLFVLKLLKQVAITLRGNIPDAWGWAMLIGIFTSLSKNFNMRTYYGNI